jgi:hypothetical protein
VDAFEQYARGGLNWLGFGTDDTDVLIMRYIDEVFGPELRALMSEDMHGVWPETDMDPSRAPSS